MIASLWANSNYDDDKGSRTKAIEEIESNFDEAVNRIRGKVTPEEEDDITENNPFFASTVKHIEKIKEITDERAPNETITVKEVLDDDYTDVDQ